MQVFLTGASGFIGGGVAQKLRAAGHRVIGLAHSVQGAQRLKATGLTVLEGDINNPTALSNIIREADAFIHTASTSDDDWTQADIKMVESVLRLYEGTGKTLIYTSGTWVLGDTGPTPVDETAPTNPTPLVAHKPSLEQDLLKAVEHNIRTIMIRPGLVYGYNKGIPAMLVSGGRQQGYVTFVGDGNNHWSSIHLDDLADLYVLALEKASPGTLLNATNETYLLVRDIALAASDAAGVSGKVQSQPVEQARQAMGTFADALVLDQQISSAKARQILDWQPQQPSLVEELISGSYTMLD